MTKCQPTLRFFLTLLFFGVLLSARGFCLQAATPPDSGPPQQPQAQPALQQDPGADNPSPADDTYVAPVLPERSVDHPGVQELGGHQSWFSGNFDWFHWGPIGITSAELFYTYAVQDTGGVRSDDSLGIFRTNVAFSRKMRHSWLILQYEPRVFYVDGTFSHPISNQDSALDLLFQPFSHVTIGLTENFNYYGGQDIFNDRVLTFNQFTGAITNPFLNNSNSTIANSLGIPVGYSFSAKTTLTVSPFFNYLQSSTGSSQPGNVSAPAVPLINDNMFEYGVRAQLNHLYSPSSSIGLFYSYQESLENAFSSTIDYQSLGLSLSHRFGRRFQAAVNLGVSYSNAQQDGAWTGVGSVTVNSSFRHSSLQATVGRDSNFTGLF